MRTQHLNAFRFAAGTAILLVLLSNVGRAADWPAFRADNARSGITAENLPEKLVHRWTYKPMQSPAPAWPLSEGYTYSDMSFDYAFHVVAAGGLVYFGSSADDCIHALDASTGRARWRFQTGGPVRFAPAYSGGSLFAVSDDGFLYCLDASTGKLKWKFRGGPSSEKIIGNGRIISRWPARSGVAVQDGIVYFCAGMWPAEGVYLHALDARTGAVLWRNDTSGGMNIRQGCWPLSTTGNGVSPQGYIAVAGDELILPTGRNIPAVFDRKTGRLRYLRGHYFPTLSMNCKRGGARVRAFGKWFFVLGRASHRKQSRILSYTTVDGEPKYDISGFEIILDGDAIYTLGGSLVACDARKVDRRCSELPTRKDLPNVNFNDPDPFAREKIYSLIQLTQGAFNKTRRWFLAQPLKPTPSNCMIKAGGALFIGGEKKIARVDIAKRKVTWSASINGKAVGLAAADGRLFVSTEEGAIHCFGPGRPQTPRIVSPAPVANPFAEDERTRLFESLARRILEESKITKGFCLDYGSGDGRLALELGKRSRLHIVCVEPDAERAERARKALHAAGLYGTRVAVFRADLAKPPFPDYFADLIVFGDLLEGGMRRRSADEMFRMLRPFGGVCVAAAGANAKTAGLSAWFARAGLSPSPRAGGGEKLLVVTRGPLEGAAEWTHQYGDPGRSGFSPDRLVRLPLRMHWFGAPGPGMMIDRHRGPPQPLVANGRLFVAGKKSIRCLDAYNGTLLWETEEAGGGRTGATRTGSNLAADADFLWVTQGPYCFRVDATMGKVTKKIHIPDRADTPWRHLAVLSERLIGSTSAGVFALDKRTFKLLWHYKAERSIHSAGIVADENHVLFVDGTSNAEYKELKKRGGDPSKVSYRLVALRCADGKPAWTKKSGTNAWSRMFMHAGIVLVEHSTRRAGRIDAFRASDGKALWTARPEYLLKYRTHPDYRRPAFAGDRVITWGDVLELETGRPVKTRHPISGAEMKVGFRVDAGCNTINATRDLFFTRSNVLAIFDLRRNIGVMHYGAIRPSCATNTIPAGGLLIMPEGAAGCDCGGYGFQTSIALKHAGDKANWFYYTGMREAGPLKHLSINIGAPGHRRDQRGRLWFNYPGTNYLHGKYTDFLPHVVREEMNHAAFEGYEYFDRYIEAWDFEAADANPYYRFRVDSVKINGTDRPWIYSSGIKGIKRIAVNVRALKGRYKVRLLFAELFAAAAGERVFDVTVQGKPVLKNFDIVREAGAPNTALVREFRDVEAEEILTIRFEPKTPGAANGAILSGIEVEGEALVPLPSPEFRLPQRLVAFSGKTGSSRGKPIPVERMFDGDKNTFGVIHDDDPKKDGVQGHMIFDLGGKYDVSALRLTGRNWGQAYNPKHVELFYFADDNPADNELPDDIERDEDIRLITRHRFSALLYARSETVRFAPVAACRYIGLRVNASYEKGNFQAANIEFLVLPSKEK